MNRNDPMQYITTARISAYNQLTRLFAAPYVRDEHRLPVTLIYQYPAAGPRGPHRPAVSADLLSREVTFGVAEDGEVEIFFITLRPKLKAIRVQHKPDLDHTDALARAVVGFLSSGNAPEGGAPGSV